MDPVSLIALTLGIGWASGINLYAAMAMLGLMGATGAMALPPDLMILTHPAVIAAAGFMYCVEFFADKVPGLDSGWDSIHTFIRIPAGAVMAAAAVWDVDPALGLAAGLVGGTLAAGSHFTKAGTRLVINTSPEPFSNWTASVTEDVAVIGGLWMALHYPVAFLAALVVMLALMIWLLPKLIRLIYRAVTRIIEWFRGTPTTPTPTNA